MFLTNATLLPSSDQAGEPSDLLISAVRFLCPVPSAFISYTSNLPFLPVTNRIFRPSGDHFGSASYSGSSTILLTSPPSAFITYMSRLYGLLLSRLLAKAILLPSGDHVVALS